MASSRSKHANRKANETTEQAVPKASSRGKYYWPGMILLGAASMAITYAATTWTRNRAPGETPTGMVWIPGGEFTMGTSSGGTWPEERPAHRVRVDGFWMDRTEVTNAQFRAFVDATGYVTTAEKPPDLDEILRQSPPGTPPPPKEKMVPGSLVFRPTANPVSDLRDISQWWHWTPGASWRHPLGPDSNIDGMDDHPVVHVSWDDAMAYASWAGKRLPTEAQWEFAARGGLEGKLFTWGDQKPDDASKLVNIWHGEFPHRNTARDGHERTAPVGSFPPNGYGLVDMAGNVWEWCADYYRADLYLLRAGQGTIVNPKGPDTPRDPLNPYSPSRAQRGGSFLCHESYCFRYRPAARHGCSPDTGMSHVGFRCVLSRP